MASRNKGQAFTWDLMISIVIYLAVVALIAFIWNATIVDILTTEETHATEWIAATTSEQLVRMEGAPPNWYRNLSSIRSIGLVDSNHPPYISSGNVGGVQSRVLDADKLLGLIELIEDKNNYSLVRGMLVGGKHDFYMEISCINNSQVDCFNSVGDYVLMQSNNAWRLSSFRGNVSGKSWYTDSEYMNGDADEAADNNMEWGFFGNWTALHVYNNGTNDFLVISMGGTGNCNGSRACGDDGSNGVEFDITTNTSGYWVEHSDDGCPVIGPDEFDLSNTAREGSWCWDEVDGGVLRFPRNWSGVCINPAINASGKLVWLVPDGGVIELDRAHTFCIRPESIYSDEISNRIIYCSNNAYFNITNHYARLQGNKTCVVGNVLRRQADAYYVMHDTKTATFSRQVVTGTPTNLLLPRLEPTIKIKLVVWNNATYL